MKMRVNNGSLRNIWQQKNYISWLVYGLSTLLIVLLQSSPRGFPGVFGAHPSPLISFVICVAILGGARTGVTVGVLAGLLSGVFSTHIFGFDAFVFMMFGLVTGLLVEWFLRANFYTALLLCAGGLLLYCLLTWLFCYVLVGTGNVSGILFHLLLPNAVYSFILTPPIYAFALVLARFVRRHSNG